MTYTFIHLGEHMGGCGVLGGPHYRNSPIQGLLSATDPHLPAQTLGEGSAEAEAPDFRVDKAWPMMDTVALMAYLAVAGSLGKETVKDANTKTAVEGPKLAAAGV